MIRTSSRAARRGWSLIDVAVAFALLAFVFVGAARFVLDLARSSETSVTRAAARREISLAEELMSGDFTQIGSCGPGVAASRFGGFGVEESGGPGSLSLFVDVNLDGHVDLVGWRVSHSALQRAVVISPVDGDCESLDLTDASWDDVLTPVEELSDAAAYFTVIRSGYPAVLTGECTGARADCDADAVRVALATRVGDTSGPVRLEAVYPVPAGGGI